MAPLDRPPEHPTGMRAVVDALRHRFATEDDPRVRRARRRRNVWRESDARTLMKWTAAAIVLTFAALALIPH